MTSTDERRRPGRAVVVNWNGRALLPACLDSLDAQSVRGDFDVVVVDNASTDGSIEYLARRPGVTLRRAPRNLGFAGGMHLGAGDFDGEWLVLLNSDARYEPEAVERMVAALAADPDAAAITAKILLDRPGAAGPVLVNSTGNLITRRGTGADRDWLAPDGTESTDPDVFGFCGGAAVLRGTALRQTGGFDPTLFLYYEDTDLSWRMRAAGWRIRYESTAVAHHLHAASSDVRSATFRFYNTRNSLLVFARHAPLSVVAGSVLRQVAGAAKASLPGRGRENRAGARWRGLGAAAAGLPAALRQRRAEGRRATVGRTEIARRYL